MQRICPIFAPLYSVFCALCIEWPLTLVLWFWCFIITQVCWSIDYCSTFYTNTTYFISVTSLLINHQSHLVSSSCSLFTVSSAGPVRGRTYHVPAPRYCPVINKAFASDWRIYQQITAFCILDLCLFLVHFLKKALILTDWAGFHLRYQFCFTFHLSLVCFHFFHFIFYLHFKFVFKVVISFCSFFLH